MFKKARLPILIILGLTIFVCTIVAIQRDEFNTSKLPASAPNNSTMFVSPEYESENNDSEAIAREARSGNVGKFVMVENDTFVDSGEQPGVFYKSYMFLSFFGVCILFLLILFLGRF